MTVHALLCAGRHYAVSGHGYNPEGDIRLDEQPAGIAGALREALVAGALCNDASLARSGQHWKITGDPTEAALLVAARKGKLEEHTLQALFPRQDVLPFDATRQYMATAHAGDAGQIIYIKGALEKLLPRCVDRLDEHGQSVPFAIAEIEAAARSLAEQGMRVLLLARRLNRPGVLPSKNPMYRKVYCMCCARRCRHCPSCMCRFRLNCMNWTPAVTPRKACWAASRWAIRKRSEQSPRRFC